ncbi:MAG TPA: hypothetical protein VGH42_13480 [Verrucomicrobiae bacterium]|jgi:hypothetical protein
MENEELKEQISELKSAIEVVLESCAYQQALSAQTLAHIEGLLAGQRELLAKATGQDKPMLCQRQQNAYEAALLRIYGELEALRENGTRTALAKLIRFLPDDPQKN